MITLKYLKTEAVYKTREYLKSSLSHKQILDRLSLSLGYNNFNSIKHLYEINKSTSEVLYLINEGNHSSDLFRIDLFGYDFFPYVLSKVFSISEESSHELKKIIDKIIPIDSKIHFDGNIHYTTPVRVAYGINRILKKGESRIMSDCIIKFYSRIADDCPLTIYGKEVVTTYFWFDEITIMKSKYFANHSKTKYLNNFLIFFLKHHHVILFENAYDCLNQKELEVINKYELIYVKSKKLRGDQGCILIKSINPKVKLEY